ncbi:Putative nuclease [Frankliniella fusca]|uniref:Nuclease n=1 Tax=Frankliniella fusca TaxID=407009 RepID=A0AAE1HLP3_9NEOP|nr:Putative nuclease [Frankliniella fusca]
MEERRRQKYQVRVNRRSVLCVIRFFATGSYHSLVGDSYDVCCAQETVSDTLKEVLELLMDPRIIGKYIRFPRTREEAQIVIDRNAIAGTKLPKTLGFIDGSLIRIMKPKLEENIAAFIGRKRFPCLNVQFVRKLYTGAMPAHPYLIQSAVRERLINFHQERECWLLGDSGYVQEPWLMVSFARGETPLPDTPEAAYNKVHCSDRNAIERLIGVYKAKWRQVCTHKDNMLRYNPIKAGKIITACAILHNICITRRAPQYLEHPRPLVNDFRRDDAPAPNGLQLVPEGAAARRRLVQYLQERRANN